MRVESAAGGGGGVGGSNVSNKKKKRRQKKQGPQATAEIPAVQRLFEVCREVFADCRPGIAPPPEGVEKIRSVLDSMKPEDVDLNPKLPYFQNIRSDSGAIPIAYLHLYECDKFSIGIFCLPRSAVIPLHNHPGMTVFSKLLFGSMHIKSYDWTDLTPSGDKNILSLQGLPSTRVRLAKVNTDTVFKAPCGTSILYPSAGGNMHRFTAMTSCAVLDVLGPPYCDPEGRHCSYYNALPYSTFSGGSIEVPANDVEYAWLEEREKKPEELYVLGAKYTGPKIVDNTGPKIVDN